MRLVLEIPDNKASAFMEVLKSISFVKIKSHTMNENSDLLKEVKQSVDELNLIKQGKIKGVSVKELLDEL